MFFRSLIGAVLFIVIGFLIFLVLAGLVGCEDSEENEKEQITITITKAPPPTLTELEEWDKDQRETDEVVRAVMELLAKHKTELESMGFGMEVRKNYLAIWKEPKGDTLALVMQIRGNDIDVYEYEE